MAPKEESTIVTAKCKISNSLKEEVILALKMPSVFRHPWFECPLINWRKCFIVFAFQWQWRSSEGEKTGVLCPTGNFLGHGMFRWIRWHWDWNSNWFLQRAQISLGSPYWTIQNRNLQDVALKKLMGLVRGCSVKNNKTRQHYLKTVWDAENKREEGSQISGTGMMNGMI